MMLNKEAAPIIDPPSWYLRRIVWYSNHRRLRGLQVSGSTGCGSDHRSPELIARGFFHFCNPVRTLELMRAARHVDAHTRES